MAAPLTDATAARRYGRIWVRRHFAKAGIKVTTAQARYIWSTGVTVEEYVALRKAFGLGEAHKARAPRKAAAAPKATAAPKVFTSSTYKSHIAQPGGDSAWVATDGTFYKVSYAGHSAFAKKCAEAGIVKGTDSWGSYVGSLEAIGWVHISGHVIRNKEVRATLTGEQVDTLIAWAATDSRANMAVKGLLQ